MKISTKSRYGLRLMVDLAVQSADIPVSLKDIADRQNISDKYLEQIVTQLNHSGLVKSVRGAQGGYILTRNPNEITVGDVLRTFEGSLQFVDCVDDDNYCENTTKCVTIDVWRKIKSAIDGVVDGITIYDLAQQTIEKTNVALS